MPVTKLTTSPITMGATTNTISLTARNKIKTISEKYSDPPRAFYLMRMDMQS